MCDEGTYCRYFVFRFSYVIQVITRDTSKVPGTEAIEHENAVTYVTHIMIRLRATYDINRVIVLCTNKLQWHGMT